jgi:CRP-like cAMP-binding protein
MIVRELARCRLPDVDTGASGEMLSRDLSHRRSHRLPPPPENILDALPNELSRGLFAKGRILSLAGGQTLFLAGAQGDGCYRVEEGLLKASVAARNGSERILAVLGPGCVVGELSMIDGAPRSASVTALRHSKLCFVSQSDLDGHIPKPIATSSPCSRGACATPTVRWRHRDFYR